MGKRMGLRPRMKSQRGRNSNIAIQPCSCKVCTSIFVVCCSVNIHVSYMSFQTCKPKSVSHFKNRLLYSLNLCNVGTSSIGLKCLSQKSCGHAMREIGALVRLVLRIMTMLTLQVSQLISSLSFKLIWFKSSR